MRPVVSRLFALALASGALLTLPNLVHASPPNTLAEALPRSADMTRRRVPLIVISADTVHVDWSDNKGREKLNALYEAENAMPPLSEVVQGFNRQIVSCSSVQVVAPLTRVVLNPYPGKVEDFARIGRERAAKLLFASLNASQWATAAGTGGLGLSNLSKPEQKGWFLSLVPDPFVIRQVKMEGNNSYSSGPDNATRTISIDQVRIHVVRTMNWMYKPKGENGTYYGFGIPDVIGRKPGDMYWVQDTQQGTQESYRDKLKDLVRLEEPNKLKKSDLSFNDPPLFGKRISLAEVKTVGGIVQRVAEQTGLELYADRRLSGLKVTIVGAPDATPDAADIMKALCYAFAGAIRKVSDSDDDAVYILTSDREGLSAPRLQLAEWAGDVDALLGEEQTTFEKKTRDGEFISGVGFGENAPGVNANTMARTEAAMVSPDRYKNGYTGFQRIPVAELDSSLQQKITSDLNNENAFAGKTDLDTQNVYAQFGVKVELLVPGYGSFSGPSLTSLESLLKQQPPNATTAAPNLPIGTMTLPPMLAKFATLKVAPTTNEETDKAVRWAKKHGFAALIIRMSLWDNDDQARLAHAVEVGKVNGIKIYPTVSLLKAPPYEEAKATVAPNNLPRTVNILGETLRQYAYRRKDAPALRRQTYYGDQLVPLRDTDWLDAGADSVQKAVAARVQDVAATPGIAGIVLTDSAAPGFALGENSYMEATTAGQFGGYNNALRVAMIRQENVDPIDVPPSESMPPYISLPEEGLIPYFPIDWNFRQRFQQSVAYRKDKTTGAWAPAPAPDSSGYRSDVSGWNKLRQDKNREWIGQMRKEMTLPNGVPLLREAAPDPSSSNLTPWTQPWTSADALPPMKRTEEALLPLTLRTTSTPESVRYGLGPQLTQRITGLKAIPYAGLVIDITALDMDKALTLLNCLGTVE